MFPLFRPTGSSGCAEGRRRVGRGYQAGLAGGLGFVLVVVAPPAGAAAAPVPVTPPGLPGGIEALQPYVGQLGCDPVAKPGVSAFRSMLLSTYTDTRTLGIVRDCGVGGASEHKEGRAFDWGVSAYNPAHVAEVKALLDWLLASENGVRAARARRLGIMYMIWNRKIWKAYQLDRGWQDYTGPSPHTDHVHFSFGWNAARQRTSWWTKQVAAVDYGPYLSSPPAAPLPTVVPVRSPDNLKVLAVYGGLVLRTGSEGAAVTRMQSALQIEADGYFGPQTEAAVRAFQASQGLSGTGVFGSAEWKALFPRPIHPFGQFQGLTSRAVTGWAADADTSSPIQVRVRVDGETVSTATADLSRPELANSHPGIGTAHGYQVPVRIPPGRHTVCVTAINVGAGTDASTGCASITVVPSPLTGLSTKPGTVELFSRGEAGDAQRRTFSAGAIGPVRSLAGRILGAPAAVSRTPDSQEVVVRGLDDQMYVSARSTDGSYTPWRSIGGSVTSRPALSARGSTGRVDLVARSTDGTLHHRVSTTAGNWSAPVSLGGAVLPGTAPALAWTASGRLDVFIIGTDKQLWRRSRSSGGTWSRWEALGGTPAGDLTAVATSWSGVSVAMRSTDDRGYLRGVASEPGSGRWTPLGGTLAAAPAIANAPGSGVTEVFATGTDGRLYRNTRTSGSWTGWIRQD